MSTYMELSAAASSLGNIERAIEVLERAVLIVDGIIMQNNGRNSLSSDTSLRQTDSATNTTGATGQWSGADNNPQNTPRTRFAAEPSQVSMIPPKFQQIYLKLLTMMMRYKVFLLNKHADLGASGVAVSLDIAQRSLAPLRQMHLSMVRVCVRACVRAMLLFCCGWVEAMFVVCVEIPSACTGMFVQPSFVLDHI